MTDLPDIWKPCFISYDLAIGAVHFVSFMNMFGAAKTPWDAVKRMETATQAQVHYQIDTCWRDS